MKEFLSKLTIKDWIIITLVIICSFSIFKYLTEPTGYKKRIKDLEDDYTKIETKIDSLDKVNKKLQDESLVYISNIEKLQSKIDSTQNLIDQKDIQIEKSKSEAARSKKDFENTKNEIQKLENNPIKRVGDDLLKSLQEKSK
jgi:predicted RNase H-like nuclease (RuvC/YqgF family)